MQKYTAGTIGAPAGNKKEKHRNQEELLSAFNSIKVKRLH